MCLLDNIGKDKGLDPNKPPFVSRTTVYHMFLTNNIFSKIDMIYFLVFWFVTAYFGNSY